MCPYRGHTPRHTAPHRPPEPQRQRPRHRKDDLMNGFDKTSDAPDELAERRERKFGETLVWLGPKGQALWAELDERDRQRPDEPDEIYQARRILTKGAADLRLRQSLIAEGYVRPEVDLGIPMPGTGCPVNVRPGVRCGLRPEGAAGLTLCATHLAQAVAEEEAAEELTKVRELTAQLDALDCPPDQGVRWARSWARKLGFSVGVSRAGRSAPRFSLYNADRTRLVAGGLSFTALIVLLELPDRALKAPSKAAAVKAGAKARRPAETPEQAAAARAEHARLREARLASREARRATRREV